MAAGPERQKPSDTNRYTKLLERIFHGKHSVEKTRIEFARGEFAEAAAALNLPVCTPAVGVVVRAKPARFAERRPWTVKTSPRRGRGACVVAPAFRAAIR